MQKHTNRFLVAAVLIAAGVIGGFFVFTAHRRAAAIERAADDVAGRIDRMIATAGDIASAQQAYVAPGQPDQPWLERSAMLLQQFGQDAAALRPLLPTDAATFDELDAGFKSLVVIDGKARDDLQEAQNLLAADLIFSEGHDTISAIATNLRNLDAAQEQRAASQRASLERQQWLILATVAVIWVAGLIALVRAPAMNAEPVHLAPANAEPSNLEPVNRAEPAAVDLAAAAAVCTALAQTSDTASLHTALGRAAAVLDAKGLIVWMGAGEELFPALAYGYDDRLVERLGAIPRHADNVTAEAWRTAELRTVAGDVMAEGALAAPVCGVAGCIGVLAAEVRHGREQDAGTRAVAAMIAAQLSAIISAWPAASTPAHKTA